MPTVNDLFHHLPSAEWDRLQHILDTFEDALQSGGRPRIGDLLPPDQPVSLPLLVELVHLDLEYRLKAGETIRVEEYLREYPVLAGDLDVVLDLLAAEFRLRRARDTGVAAGEYLDRFPQYRAELPGRLHADSVRLGRVRRAAAPPSTAHSPAHTPGPSDESAGPAPPAGAALDALPEVPGYEVLSVLGRGGMGIVYKARQVPLGRTVALKMILTGRYASPEQRERFLTEARAAARLQHPNIVQVYEIGAHQGLPYFSLEFVEGGALDRKLAGAPQPARYAAALVQALARAMHSAHTQGVVHRDLKPANVLLTAQGTPKVADFGLAKQLDADVGRTRTGDVLGTPSYMAPEQATGQIRDVGPATDVYALGAILYETLTGRPPFRGPTVLDTLEQVRTREPVPPRSLQPGVPRDLELICLKCLQKDPARRYASAEQLADELRRHLGNQPLRHTRAVSRAERAWRWCRRNPALAVSGGLALLFLTVGLLVSVTLLAREAEQARSLGNANRELETTNTQLAEKKRAAEDALKKYQVADRGRVRFARLSGELFLERGLTLCEDQGPAAGLPWLAAALQVAPADEGLRRRISLNLAEWGQGVGKALFPHPEAVTALTFSPDGKTVLTGCNDRKLRLWEASTGRLLGEPVPHDGPVSVVAFAPDGRTFLAGSVGARLWDASTRKPLGEFPHGGWVACAAFPPGGKTMLLAGSGEVRLWDLAAKERVWEVTPKHSPDGRPDPVPGGALKALFSPDGKTVLVVYSNREPELRDAATGKTVRLLQTELGGTGEVVALSPDGRLVAMANGALGITAIRLWDTATGKPAERIGVESGAGASELMAAGVLSSDVMGLRALAFSPDGKTLLVVGATETQRLDVATGKPLARPVTYGSQDYTSLLVEATHRTALSADGTALLIADRGRVELWPLTAPANLGETLSFAHPNARTAALSPDGAMLLTAGADPVPPPKARAARLWDAVKGRPLTSPLPHADAILAVAFSPEGKTFLTACADRTTQRWDAATGKPLGPPLRHPAPAGALAFSAAGDLFLVATGTSHAEVYETATGKLRTSVGVAQPGVGFNYRSMARWRPSAGFGDDGKTVWLAAGVSRTTYDLATGEGRHAIMKGYAADARYFGLLARTLATSPDGKVMLTRQARDPKQAVFVSSVTSAPFGVPLAHDEEVVDAGFSADGKAVVTVTARRARVWDAQSGKPVGRPLPLEEPPLTAVFSPGNALLLLAGVKSARIWDVAAGEAHGDNLPHGATVTVAAFSRDGKLLVTGTGKAPTGSPEPGRPDVGEARVWDLATGKPVGKPARLPGPPADAALARGKLFLTHDTRLDTALVWETATGRPPGAAPAEEPAGPQQVKEALPQQAPEGWGVRQAAFSPDGELLAVCDNTNRPVARVHLLPTSLAAPARTALAVEGVLFAVTFSPNSKFLLTSGLNARGAAEVRLWTAADGKPFGSPLPLPGPVRSMACSPDGTRVATAGPVRLQSWSPADTVRLWDPAVGRPVGPPAETNMAVNSVGFSPDGRLYATVENMPAALKMPYSYRVRLWDAETGTRAGRPLAHAGPVWAVAFSRDGKTLVTACVLSEVDTGKWAAALTGPSEASYFATRVEVQRWPVPVAPSASPERYIAWTELLTGMEVDEGGSTHPLDAAAMQARRERLRALGGPPGVGADRP